MLKYFSTVHSQPDLTEHQTWLQHPYQKEKRYFCITVLKEFQLYNRHSAVIKSRCNHQYCLVVFTSFFSSLYFPSSYFPYGACSNSGTNSVCTHASPQGSCQEPCPAQCSITLRQPSPPSPPQVELFWCHALSVGKQTSASWHQDTGTKTVQFTTKHRSGKMQILFKLKAYSDLSGMWKQGRTITFFPLAL